MASNIKITHRGHADSTFFKTSGEAIVFWICVAGLGVLLILSVLRYAEGLSPPVHQVRSVQDQDIQRQIDQLNATVDSLSHRVAILDSLYEERKKETTGQNRQEDGSEAGISPDNIDERRRNIRRGLLEQRIKARIKGSVLP